MSILVTGGAGYIGAPVAHTLMNRGHDVVVFDNLSQGHRSFVENATFIRGDLRNRNDIQNVFESYPISVVIHLGAKALVQESVRNPEKYYDHNVTGSLNLLRTMKEKQVRKIVFSSTAAVYGTPDEIPIPESHPRHPVNPYGSTKLFVERMLEDFRKAFDIGYVVFRYFNAAGAIPEWDLGEQHDPETHLIPNILNAVKDEDTTFSMFGTDYDTRDGTCIRDFIHVRDLANLHALALEYLEEGKGDIYNVGTGRGSSVKEVVDCVKQVVNPSFEVREESRRAGDPSALIADPEKIRQEWDWEPQHSSLQNIVQTAWKWHQKINE